MGLTGEELVQGVVDFVADVKRENRNFEILVTGSPVVTALPWAKAFETGAKTSNDSRLQDELNIIVSKAMGKEYRGQEIQIIVLNTGKFADNERDLRHAHKDHFLSGILDRFGEGSSSYCTYLGQAPNRRRLGFSVVFQEDEILKSAASFVLLPGYETTHKFLVVDPPAIIIGAIKNCAEYLDDTDADAWEPLKVFRSLLPAWTGNPQLVAFGEPWVVSAKEGLPSYIAEPLARNASSVHRPNFLDAFIDLSASQVP
ncbi:hypothetical protein JCM16303_001858 [Sporobolomyces ruberrimus]